MVTQKLHYPTRLDHVHVEHVSVPNFDTFVRQIADGSMVQTWKPGKVDSRCISVPANHMPGRARTCPGRESRSIGFCEYSLAWYLRTQERKQTSCLRVWFLYKVPKITVTLLRKLGYKYSEGYSSCFTGQALRTCMYEVLHPWSTKGSIDVLVPVSDLSR